MKDRARERECHAFSNKNYYLSAQNVKHFDTIQLRSLSFFRFTFAGRRCDKFHHHFIYHPRFSISEITYFVAVVFVRWQSTWNFITWQNIRRASSVRVNATLIKFLLNFFLAIFYGISYESCQILMWH